MIVAVLVKTPTGVALDAADAQWRDGRVSPGVMSAHDAHAVEEAVRLKEAGTAREVVLVAMAPANVLGALREGLATGADRAVLLSDAALEGADILGRSRALAALLAKVGADLALFCPWSGDIDGSLLWGSAAARLGRPAIAQARTLEVAPDGVRCIRQIEAGDLTMTAPMPCLVELAETINKPRYPTMKGRQSAKTKPVATLQLADLELEPGAVARGTTVLISGPAPARPAPIVLDDISTAAAGIVAFLEERNLLA